MAAKVKERLQEFKTLKIGGGGYLTGHAQHKDGTLLARNDGYGCYLWDEEAKQWRQLVTTKSMPKDDWVQPKDNPSSDSGGTYDIAIAPSNSSVFYISMWGRIYRSANKGKSWTRAKFELSPKNKQHANTPTRQRMVSHRIAVSPRDENHVLLGDQDSGLWQTRDGGKTWAQAGGVPLPLDVKDANDPGITGILFDSATDGLIYCASHGNGWYTSTDNGENWKSIKGPNQAPIDCDIALDGTVYCITFYGTGTWRYDGKWTELSRPGINRPESGHGVACDPFDANHVVFCHNGGGFFETRDRGDTITEEEYEHPQNGEPDVPWLRRAYDTFMAVGDISFHPTERDTIMVSMGVGFLKGKIRRTASGVVFDSTIMTAGVEMMVANQVISTPKGLTAVASWDRPIFRIENPDVYPDQYLGDAGEEINHGTSLDWCAENPDIIAGTMFQKGSGVSRDGLRTFTPFASSPFPEFQNAGGAGCIAVGGPDNYVWVGSNRQGMACTMDGGASWTRVNVPGIEDPAADDGLNFVFYLKRHNVCADRVKPGVFYLWHATEGIFRSRDGGKTWGRRSESPMNWSQWNAKLRVMPTVEGYLFATGGADQSGLIRSKNGGETWSEIEGLGEVVDVGFGAKVPGQDYTVIWIAGTVNGVTGIYRSEDNCASWLKVAEHPLGSLGRVLCIDGDKKIRDRCYIGWAGQGYAYCPGSDHAAASPLVIPGYMLIPAAAMYRFGKRWSDLKAAHNAFEREVEEAMAATTDTVSPQWRGRFTGLLNAWKKL